MIFKALNDILMNLPFSKLKKIKLQSTRRISNFSWRTPKIYSRTLGRCASRSNGISWFPSSSWLKGDCPFQRCIFSQVTIFGIILIAISCYQFSQSLLLIPSMLLFLLLKKEYISRNRLNFAVLPFDFKRYDRLQFDICEGLAVLCRNYGIRCDGL